MVCSLPLFLISLGVLLAFSFPVHADELTARQQKLQRIYRDIQFQKEKVRRARVKEQGALSQLFFVRANLSKTRDALSSARQDLSFNEERLSQVRGQLQEAETKYASEMKRFLSRLSEFYKSGEMSYLEMILGTNDLSEFNNRLYYFGKIIEHDSGIVEQLRKYRNFIQTKRTQLTQVTDQIRSLTVEISEKETLVAAQAREKDRLYQSLRRERAIYEQQLNEKRQASAQLEGIIRNILARTKGRVVAKVTGRLQWPLSGAISSRFGYRRSPLWGGSDFHTGIDITSPYGRPIQAADGGEVVYSGWWDGYGNAVVIDHGKGRSTVYAHMSRIFMNRGQKVVKGQSVGLVGSTGYSTGPHLHFEVRVGGKPQNPLSYLP